MFKKLKEIINRIIELAKKCEEKQPINPIIIEKEVPSKKTSEKKKKSKKTIKKKKKK